MKRAEDPGSYQVVARRFRPRSFAEVVGQDAILGALKKALASGRVPHAFLFSGSRGVGKTTSARILARALNCKNGPTPEPCGKCESCESILAGTNPDVIEIDAASHNMVDDIRELRDRVAFAAMSSRYKVYILDEAHMLTRSAFNALLKTLEEPPPNVVFVLATTELHKVPETIRSRCQVLLFRRVSDADISARLKMICTREKVSVQDDVLAEITRDSRGGMRDAETALERVLPVAKELGQKLDVATYRELQGQVGPDRSLSVCEALLRGEAAPALQFAADVASAGADEREALGEVLALLRAVLLLKIDGAESGLVAETGDLRARLQALAQGADLTRLDAMIQAGLLGRERIRRLEDRRLVLELSLLRMAQAGSLSSLSDLVAMARAGGFAAEAPRTSSLPARSAPMAPAAASDLKSRLMQRLQQERPLMAATIELCQVEGPDAHGTVTLRLATDKRMHIDRLAAEPLRQGVKKLLEELTGRSVQLSVVTAGDTPAAAAPTAPARPAPGPAVRRVMEKFDGQIVDVNDRPDT